MMQSVSETLDVTRKWLYCKWHMTRVWFNLKEGKWICECHGKRGIMEDEVVVEELEKALEVVNKLLVTAAFNNIEIDFTTLLGASIGTKTPTKILTFTARKVTELHVTPYVTYTGF
jgi:hypothetical protein